MKTDFHTEKRTFCRNVDTLLDDENASVKIRLFTHIGEFEIIPKKQKYYD